MKVTRRKLARLLAAGSAAVPLLAQAPAKRNADQELEEAKQAVKSAAAQIRRVPLAMSVEPAFRFRA